MARRPTLSYGVTLDEWRAFMETATRNLTDPPIGNPTRRRIDAQHSALAPEPHHRHTTESTKEPAT